MGVSSESTRSLLLAWVMIAESISKVCPPKELGEIAKVGWN
jgi:hypothetical protein